MKSEIITVFVFSLLLILQNIVDVEGADSVIVIPNVSPHSNDQFGRSVSVSGDNVAIGAFWKNTGGYSQSGEVYFYDCSSSNCVLVDTILNPTPSITQFGGAVSINGTNVVVGRVNTGGDAYLYNCSGGNCVLVDTISNPMSGANNGFGSSVSISGDNVAIGAIYENIGSTGFAGAVYVYDCSSGNCNLKDTITNPIPVSNGNFGDAVVIDGTKIIIGSSETDVGTVFRAGVAYFYDCSSSNCVLVDTISNPTPGEYERFGDSVGLSGTNVVIGENTDVGKIYFYDCSGVTCVLVDTISNPSGVHDGFGYSISISENNLIAGSMWSSVDGVGTGKAYHYVCTSVCTLDSVLPNLNSGYNMLFGFSVSASKHNFVVGSPGGGQGQFGEAYFYNCSDGNCPLTLSYSSSESTQAVGQTTILPSSCGISFPNGSAINYGPLLQNTLSSIVRLNMTNTGSVNGTLAVEGGNWKDVSNNDVMFVNVTHYRVSTPGDVYGQGTALTNSSQSITIDFEPELIHAIFWQIFTTLINPSFSGNATQTMNFTVSC